MEKKSAFLLQGLASPPPPAEPGGASPSRSLPLAEKRGGLFGWGDGFWSRDKSLTEELSGLASLTIEDGGPYGAELLRCPRTPRLDWRSQILAFRRSGSTERSTELTLRARRSPGGAFPSRSLPLAEKRGGLFGWGDGFWSRDKSLTEELSGLASPSQAKGSILRKVVIPAEAGTQKSLDSCLPDRRGQARLNIRE